MNSEERVIAARVRERWPQGGRLRVTFDVVRMEGLIARLIGGSQVAVAPSAWHVSG